MIIIAWIKGWGVEEPAIWSSTFLRLKRHIGFQIVRLLNNNPEKPRYVIPWPVFNVDTFGQSTLRPARLSSVTWASFWEVSLWTSPQWDADLQEENRELLE